MTGTRHRVDILPAELKITDYKVPCGMSSIRYLSNKRPNIAAVIRELKLPAGMAIEFSAWDDNCRDYLPTAFYCNPEIIDI